MTDTMSTSFSRKGIPYWVVWALVCGIVVFDQYTKLLSTQYLERGVPHTIFTGFDLLLAYNDGAAFSFLNGAGGWQRWLLGGISVTISAALIVWLWRIPRQQRLLTLALAFILGGALGNLYDRVVMGYVVDFISVYFGDWRFATFNVADAAISCGAALMGLDLLLNGTRHG